MIAQIVIILVMGVGLAAGFALFTRRNGAPEAGVDLDGISVSIIIPARNEERNLPRLLSSIARGGVRDVEVIVVDDHSTDKTARVAQQFGVRLLPSALLPPGWTGKTWACAQGGSAARGEVLFFLDADTWFENGGLVRALKTFLVRHARPLSFLPWHATKNLFEQASLFFNLIMAGGLLGAGQLCGQSLVVRRQDYFEVGGHGVVRAEILENLVFAKIFRTRGYGAACLSGRHVLSMRMYAEGISALTQGWRKAFNRGAREVTAWRLGATAVWISGLVLAFGNLMFSLRPHSAWALISLVMYAAFCLQLFWASRAVGNFWILSQVFYPLPLIFFHWIFFSSRRLQRSGRGVEWKGRSVTTQTF